ncbi:MAG: UDP-N-acetylmuramoyl-tripeptide--D-alanyl-D-alanine ligase [Verrucomicrobiales bacterium]|jgi:UDP-N-acetylmuramoyl-tripeptide--D-alanyl-D-alanine ligase
MRPLSFTQLASWAGGELLQGVPDDSVTAFSTDTRKLTGGELFIALKGENFDAHDHLKEAVEKNVGALFVQQLPTETQTFSGAIVRVRNTLTGLQELARNYLGSLNLKSLGITGSSGKTSTKDLTRAVISQAFSVVATQGNLNNHIGVPLTILSAEPEHEIGIFEMGMNHPGEIEVLAEIAQPTLAIITNIGSAHIENMKSRDAIAKEKGMLAEAVPSDGWVILSANDDFTESIRARTRAQVITAGINAGDVRATDLEMDIEGSRFKLSFEGNEVAASLPIVGEHMVSNATLAAAAGLKLGMSLEQIAAGLASAELSGGRLQQKTVAGLNVLDDSYNANPDSMRAALKTLRRLPTQGRRIAVLGLMAELGEHREDEHRKLGEAVAEFQIAVLLTIGEEGRFIAEAAENQVETRVFDDHAQVSDFLRENASPADLILLKGSRSAGMERVLTQLTATA